jgi:hypothetical protein
MRSIIVIAAIALAVGVLAEDARDGLRRCAACWRSGKIHSPSFRIVSISGVPEIDTLKPSRQQPT